MTYRPEAPPQLPPQMQALGKYVYQELLRIAETLVETEALDLRPVNVEPTRPRIGLIVYADGTDWDPGSGAGLYVYESGGWTAL